ncbi:hypothetical protein GOODEAATRI_012106, partial [Goodea atripinnis]
MSLSLSYRLSSWQSFYSDVFRPQYFPLCRFLILTSASNIRAKRMSQLQFQCPPSPIPAASAPLQLGQPQLGYSIPCATGALPSESASQPIRSSALPAGSATPYNTTTVRLTLGDQHWEAEGTSIKKAQHSAAASALSETTLPKPTSVFCLCLTVDGSTHSMELNALCLKLGKKPIFKPIDPYPGMRPPNYNYNVRAPGPYQRSMQQYYYPFPPVGPIIYHMELSIGSQQFIGKGRTWQQAKHDAAAKALKVLQKEPMLQQLPVQAKKEKEPEYSMVTERGLPRRREFVMQVTVCGQTAEGLGPSKKVAKRNAAEKMLELLGYKVPQPQPPKPALKSDEKVLLSSKEEDFRLPYLNHQQLPAGILPMVPEVAQAVGVCQGSQVKDYNRAVPNPGKATITATIANELLYAGTSLTAVTILKNKNNLTQVPHGPLTRPSEQLSYLASVQGLQVEYKDFPKNNKNEFVSLINCSSQLPLISHGIGKDIESCHDMVSNLKITAK